MLTVGCSAWKQTIIILLNIMSNKSDAYLIFAGKLLLLSRDVVASCHCPHPAVADSRPTAVTNPPRICAFVWISHQLCPKTWYVHPVVALPPLPCSTRD